MMVDEIRCVGLGARWTRIEHQICVLRACTLQRPKTTVGRVMKAVSDGSDILEVIVGQAPFSEMGAPTFHVGVCGTDVIIFLVRWDEGQPHLTETQRVPDSPHLDNL